MNGGLAAAIHCFITFKIRFYVLTFVYANCGAQKMGHWFPAIGFHDYDLLLSKQKS